MRLILLDHGMYVLVAGEGPPHESAIQPWIEATQAAGAAIGKSQTEFAWAAVIGPRSSLEGGDQHFQGETSAGPLNLRSGGVRFDEWTDGAQPSLRQRSKRWSWPVIVEGTAPGYDWFAAVRVAGFELHRLCGLLTVAWDRNWTVREAPQAMPHGTMNVPDHAWWDTPDEASSHNLLKTSVDVPDWITRAWTRLDEDPELGHALAIYQEGMAIQHEHPSLANVAYVGAIETLGARLVRLKHCNICGATQGSVERFRSALGHVVTPDEAAELTATYRTRSKTAHAGNLHGTEVFAGAFYPPGLFSLSSPQSRDSFFGVVFRLRLACRKLLELALKHGIPAPG